MASLDHTSIVEPGNEWKSVVSGLERTGRKRGRETNNFWGNIKHIVLIDILEIFGKLV